MACPVAEGGWPRRVCQSHLACTYVEAPFDRWLYRDDWWLARLGGYTKSFLILSVCHLLASGGISAVPLGAANLWAAELPCGGSSNGRRLGDQRTIPVCQAPDLRGDLHLRLGWSCRALVLEQQSVRWTDIG